MPIDPKAQAFLSKENAPIQTLGPSAAPEATRAAHAAYKQKEFVERSGKLYEDLIGFYLQQKKAGAYRDDECIAAVALLTINLREAYGRPQYEAEASRWTPEIAATRLAEFDQVCEAMQAYYDSDGKDVL